MENLGTTFGGGPMACAVAEATIDAIEKEGLLENVTRVSAYLRKTCKVGPVVDFQGLGFLHGLRLDKPAKDVQKALLAKDILAGTAGDPAILRLLPAFILQEEHIDRLRAALADV
jgi:acetylornithine/N-succinyldiaminopimelate aminotransferase